MRIALIIIKTLLPILTPFLKRLIDLAYKHVETWADRKFATEGKKPTSQQKMEKAVDIVRAHRPDVDPAVVRAMIELKHVSEQKKSQKKGKAR